MRVSILGLTCVVGRDGTYGALLNKGRLKHMHMRMVSPIGGGLHYEPEGLKFLLELGAYEFEGKPGEPELRFQIPDESIPYVVEWFKTKQGRETSARREAYEELVIETGILNVQDFAPTIERPLYTATYEGETARNVSNKATLYLIEVSQLHFSDFALDKMEAAAELPVAKRWMYWLNQAELDAGRTIEGTQIGEITYETLYRT